MTEQSPIVISLGTPRITAELFKTKRRPNLIRYQEEFFDWSDGAYRPMEDDTIESQVSKFLAAAKVSTLKRTKDAAGKPSFEEEFSPCHPKDRDIREVCNALKHICHVPLNTMSPPVWLEGTASELATLNPRDIIACKNGLLDITTRTLYPPTPQFFTLNATDIAYDPDAPKPVLWSDFTKEVFKGRTAMVDLLQEWYGYNLTQDTSKQRIMFLWGRPRSGKGTILRVLRALVGEGNCSFPSIADLAGQFGRWSLIGKSVAQITEMDTSDRTKLATAAGILNGISGEDHQTIDRKNKTPWTGKLPSRFSIAGNTLPNFGSHTGAMLTRLLVLAFEVSVEGREDRDLTDKLLAELPGILNWALDGLDRLRQRGDFIEPKESKEAKVRLRYRSNPVVGFIAERCTVEPGRGDREGGALRDVRSLQQGDQFTVPADERVRRDPIAGVPIHR
jgi:putative DNA primase/helicase